MIEAVLYSGAAAAILVAFWPKLTKAWGLVITLIGALSLYGPLVFGWSRAQEGVILEAYHQILSSPDVMLGFRIDTGNVLIIAGLAPLFLLLVVDNWLTATSQVPQKRLYSASILLGQTASTALIASDSLVNVLIFWPLLLFSGFLSLMADKRFVNQPEREPMPQTSRSMLAGFLTPAVLSTVVIIAVLTLLGASAGGFDHAVLTDKASVEIPPQAQWWTLFGIFAAVLPFVPAFPLHGWMRKTGIGTSPISSTLILGLTGKIGILVLIMSGLRLLPDASQPFVPTLLAAGMITSLYAGMAAFGCANRGDDWLPFLASAQGGILLVLAAMWNDTYALTALGYGVIVLPYITYLLARASATSADDADAALSSPDRKSTWRKALAMAIAAIGAFLPGSSGFMLAVLAIYALKGFWVHGAVIAFWFILNGAFFAFHRNNLYPKSQKTYDLALLTVISAAILALGLFPSGLIILLNQWAEAVLAAS